MKLITEATLSKDKATNTPKTVGAVELVEAILYIENLINHFLK